MLRPRVLQATIERALRSFPVVLVTGPRQSGKTTLLRHGWGKSHSYVSLEDPNVRERALADPVGFLNDHPPPLILDEIQYAPQLLSYVKSRVDDARRAGRWLLSGSQVFPLMHGVTQSLAGRVAVLTLHPFSQSEARGSKSTAASARSVIDALRAGTIGAGRRLPAARWILRGGFPERWVRRGMDGQLWAASYVQTYLERDVRSVLRVADLATFQTFVRLVAARTAQILNLSDLARDAGISHPTARQWLGVLEASHQVFLLRPWHGSVGKRLVKSPKLYFLDTGIACYLAGIGDERAALHGPMGGALFETAVVVELVKAFAHRGEPPPLWFWREHDGGEVDVLVESGSKLWPVEIKATSTPRPAHAQSVVRWRAAARARAGEGAVVCSADRAVSLVPGVRAVPWDSL